MSGKPPSIIAHIVKQDALHVIANTLKKTIQMRFLSTNIQKIGNLSTFGKVSLLLRENLKLTQVISLHVPNTNATSLAAFIGNINLLKKMSLFRTNSSPRNKRSGAGYGLRLWLHNESAKQDRLIGHHAYLHSRPPTTPWSAFVQHSAPKYTGSKLKYPGGKCEKTKKQKRARRRVRRGIRIFN